MAEFSKAEERFLATNELGRLATVSSDGMPHVVPVCYIYEVGILLIATDYSTRKYRNLLSNEKVAFVVDTYRPNRGILVQGNARMLESGPEFRAVYDAFYKKFDWVRADPWKEGEAPFVRIESIRKVSWGI